MIKPKRIKYCLEFSPDVYSELIKEANEEGYKSLSKYLKQIITLRHNRVSLEDKKTIQELNKRILGAGS